MAQFDVYRNPHMGSQDVIPYLLNIQNDLLDDLNSRLVVPLVLDYRPIKHLNPVFVIEKRKVVMATQEMAATPLNELGEPVLSLAKYRTEILSAIDFLLLGF